METTRELKSLNFIYVDKAVDVQILFNRLTADQAAARLVLKSFTELRKLPSYFFFEKLYSTTEFSSYRIHNNLARIKGKIK